MGQAWRKKPKKARYIPPQTGVDAEDEMEANSEAPVVGDTNVSVNTTATARLKPCVRPVATCQK